MWKTDVTGRATTQNERVSGNERIYFLNACASRTRMRRESKMRYFLYVVAILKGVAPV